MKIAFLLLAFAQAALANQPLYLHFFTPTNYEKGNASTPPRRVLSLRLPDTGDFHVSVEKGDRALTGHIEARGNKYFLKVEGTYGPSAGTFEGEVELEKPFDPQGYIISSGVSQTRFVLSIKPDCAPFLRQQTVDDEKMARHEKIE